MPTRSGSSVTYVAVGEVIDMHEKRISQPRKTNRRKFTLTLDVRSARETNTVRLLVENAEEMMHELKGKVKAITFVTKKTSKVGGKWYATVLVGVVLERTDEQPTLVSHIKETDREHQPKHAGDEDFDEELYKPEPKKVLAVPEVDHTVQENTVSEAEKQKAREDIATKLNLGLGSFLDALHGDEDLSGVKATDDELPFN